MKRRIIPAILAAFLCSQALAATEFYVVIPMPGRIASNSNTTPTAPGTPADTPADTPAIQLTLNSAVLPAGKVGKLYQGFDFSPLLVVTGDPNFSAWGVQWGMVPGPLPAGMRLTNGKLLGTPLESGTTELQIRATYAGQTVTHRYQVNVAGALLAMDSATLDSGSVGQNYSYDLKPLLSIEGNRSYNPSQVTWSVVSSTLPAGLALRTDGTITGVPTAPGTGTITARATYYDSSAEQTYQIVAQNISMSLATANLPPAVDGIDYFFDLNSLLNVSGDSNFSAGGVTWSVVNNTLPDGLLLRTDGTIRGAAYSTGSGSITVRATYKGVSTERTYSVRADMVMLGQTPGLIEGTANQPLSVNLSNYAWVDGDPDYTGTGIQFSLVMGGLPDGVTLNADGSYSGVPTTAGSTFAKIRVTYRGIYSEEYYMFNISP